MGSCSLKIFFGICFLMALIGTFQAADPAENLTETDDAEFRQGGIGQQLLSSYPGMTGIYGNAGNYPYMTATSGASGGYANILRNLYRPPNFGLTDKVKHWVKSFMNRRQYVKPYYTPSVSGLQYNPEELGGKPVFVGGNSYKAISIPLRQLQKYYKPYYATGGDAAAQFMQQQPPRSASNPANAAGSSILNYSPSVGGSQSSAASGNLYASESTGAGHFSGGSPGLFGAAGSSNSGLFASNHNIFSSGGSSSNVFSPNEGANSPLFSAAGLSGSGLFGTGGNPNTGLYHNSNSGSSSSVFSLDSNSGGLYGSDGGQFFGSNGGSNYGSNAAASSILSSLNAGANGGTYGDLYASGANPSATIYSPNTDQVRGFGNKKQQPSYGVSSSALYMPSADQRDSDSSYAAKSSQETINSFNINSSRSSQAEPSYSVSFQPAQGKSSGFQPVSFGSDDGEYKAGSFQGKSS